MSADIFIYSLPDLCVYIITFLLHRHSQVTRRQVRHLTMLAFPLVLTVMVVMVVLVSPLEGAVFR